MIFRKGKKGDRRHAADPYAEPTQSTAPPATTPNRRGPYDADDVDTNTERTGRIDFGSMQVRPVPGTEVGVHVENDMPRAVLVRSQSSVLDLRAFAAPRNGSLWDELRKEVAADATKKGGLVSERRGPYGVELDITMQVQTSDGRHGTQQTKLIGIDGPRWFLRVQLWGAAAQQPEAAQPLLAALSDVVVVRGKAPMAPRDFIPITPPSNQQSP